MGWMKIGNPGKTPDERYEWEWKKQAKIGQQVERQNKAREAAGTPYHNDIGWTDPKPSD